MTRCVEITEGEWAESDAVLRFITARKVADGGLLDVGDLETALASRRIVRDAMRCRVVELERELREARAKIPKPPPPPRPRPTLVRDDASRADPALAVDPAERSAADSWSIPLTRGAS